MKAMFQAVLWTLIIVTSASKVNPPQPKAPERPHTYWDNPLAVTNPRLLAYYIAVAKPPYAQADPKPADNLWCQGAPWLCGQRPPLEVQ